MATSRSLGTLTLDLIAKIGGFESGMDRAARTADRKGREISAAQRRAAKESEESWSKIGAVIGGIFAGITVGAVFQKFVAETRGAEQEQAQLAAALKSTGEAAGISQIQLNAMADAMEGRSIFSAGDINSAQARLLSYTGVVGEQFPQAMQAAIDMATRMGMDVKQAAETVGKALDSPKDGLSALSKQGFRFTDDQKAMVEQLQATGRSAEAQSIILSALELSYGGAAAAARDTFGGAMTALQHNIDSLLTGDSGSMEKLKGSVEEMNQTLASPQTKEAFQTVVGWMTDFSTAAIRGAANIITFINSSSRMALFTGKDLGLRSEANFASAEVKKLGSELEKLHTQMQSNPADAGLKTAFDATRKRLEAAMGRAATASESLKGFADKLVPPTASDATSPVIKMGSPIDATGAAARAIAAEAARKAAEAAGKKGLADAKAAEKAAETYIQQLNDQIGKVNELSTVERVLYDLQLGKIELSHQEKDIALRLAQEIDDTKALAEEKKADLELMQARISAQREFNATMDQYARQLDGMGLGNRAREKMAGVSQIDDKYAGDLRRLEDGKRQAIYDDKWTVQAEARYADELAMIEAFKGKALSAYDDYWGKMTTKQGDWALGAQEALLNYASDSANAFKQTEDLVGSAFKGMEDALVNFVMTGKGNFADLAKSIIADLVRIQIKAAMTSAIGGGGGGGILSTIFRAVAGSFGAPAASSSMYSLGSSGTSISGFRADGGPVSAGGLYRVKERGPEMLDEGGKQYLMMGNQSGSVAANGGGGSGSGVTWTIVNQTTGRIDNVVEQEVSPGQRALIIQEAVMATASQFSDPNSRTSKALAGNYKLQRNR